LVAATLVSSFCAAPVAWAQHARSDGSPAAVFQNAWFWGLHAGGTSFSTPAQSSKMSGTIGAEWMITRTKGGMYVAYDQAQFHGTSSIADGSTSTGFRPVSINTLRTVSAAAVAFPYQFGALRPYAGIGLQLHLIGSASARADSAGTPASQDVVNATEDARSHTAPFLLVGGQWQHGKAAVFAQLSSTTSSDQFLINSPITQITFGVRYNFGSSIAY